jgi:hypothetical protein
MDLRGAGAVDGVCASAAQPANKSAAVMMLRNP